MKFYDWIIGTVKKRYRNNKLSLEEINVIEKLVGKSLNEMFNGGSHPVKVIDITENKEVGTFESQAKAAKTLREKYNIKLTNSLIGKRLTGKTTTPYKGRFMFYYADEEDVRESK